MIQVPYYGRLVRVDGINIPVRIQIGTSPPFDGSMLGLRGDDEIYTGGLRVDCSGRDWTKRDLLILLHALETAFHNREAKGDIQTQGGQKAMTVEDVKNAVFDPRLLANTQVVVQDSGGTMHSILESRIDAESNVPRVLVLVTGDKFVLAHSEKVSDAIAIAKAVHKGTFSGMSLQDLRTRLEMLYSILETL